MHNLGAWLRCQLGVACSIRTVNQSFCGYGRGHRPHHRPVPPNHLLRPAQPGSRSEGLSLAPGGYVPGLRPVRWCHALVPESRNSLFGQLGSGRCPGHHGHAFSAGGGDKCIHPVASLPRHEHDGGRRFNGLRPAHPPVLRTTPLRWRDPLPQVRLHSARHQRAPLPGVRRADMIRKRMALVRS